MTIELINQYDEKRTVYPLDRDILIPHPFNLNDTLQHLDGQINCAIPYDSEIHKFLVENTFLKSKVYNEESQTIFTGVVKDGLEWIDNGTPEPLSEISLTLQDNGYYLNNTPEEDITYINQSLTTILADICKRCNLQIGSNLPTDTISVAQIKQNTTYLNFINDILFQYCYAFGFDANGVLQTINIKEMETSEVFDDFFTGLKFTKTTKNYNAIHLNYGELTVKQNEQVYYEGGEIASDNTIQPIIIQPNAYYPPEATPIIEEQDGKVIQNFLDGFAQAVTLFNGEKKYQRSKNTELIYTEDHVVTKDYSDNLTLDRTDFTATSASVRFYNNSATDAELYQLAIRATAYYRRQKKLILGDGKKFEYEAIYIYDSQRASTFANFLAKYFLGGNYKIAARTEKNFLPGTKLTLKTGISGIATRAIVISSTYNPREQNYNITFLTETDLALSPKFYQDRHTSQFPGPKGDKGDKGDTGVRGSLEFSGTEINAISDITEATYTITTASTGITSATMPILVGDTYINVTTQDVWICSTEGTPTTAKWKYQGRRCSDKDDSNRFRMFTPATDNGSMTSSLTKSVVKGENPFGKIDDLLKITNTNGPIYSCYFLYNRRTKIDPKKTYRYVAYVKKEDENYTDYFGLQNYMTSGQYIGALSTGTALYSAYFTSAANFGTLGRWYMIVGYVVANGTTTAPDDSGVYDMVTKQKVRAVTNFQWLSTATAIKKTGTLIRYAQSDSTKTGTAYLYDVRLDEVNGTEPSLNELLNLDTTTKSKGTWTASTAYNTGDIVYLNGNSYICTENHTSGTSFSTTNWNLIASKGADGKDGTDGKNAITMTSVTTPNGEYNGQIGFWQGQVYQWNGTGWVLTSGVLPTDPVLHYSFDELPDMPDGGTVIYAKNKNWESTDSFAGTATISVKNCCLVLDGNGVASFAYKSFTTHSNCYAKIKMSYNIAGVVYVYEKGNTVITSLNFKANEEKIVVLKLSDNNSLFGFSGFTGKITIKELYIGNTTYATPLIDNSNNGYTTSFQGIVTKGVNNKGVYLLNQRFGTSFKMPSDFTVSLWCKAENDTKGLRQDLINTENSVFIIRNGATWGDYLMYYVFTQKADGSYDKTGHAFIPTGGLLPVNTWVNLAITKKDNIIKCYYNGELKRIETRETGTLAYHSYLNIGNVDNTRGQTIDDFQIFDRALSDQEVLGLYLARGNTPKQYTRADYEIDLLPETIPQHTPKYLGPVSSESQINALEKKVGDWCLFTGTTTSLYQLGQVYRWNGQVWEIDNDDGHRAQTINDCLALLKNGENATTYASQFVDLLVSQEVLAEKMSALEVRFQNFVASFKEKDLAIGDEFIYMGKNPLNPKGFEFSLGQFFGKSNNYNLYKNLFKIENNKGLGLLKTNGKIIPYGGIDSYADVSAMGIPFRYNLEREISTAFNYITTLVEYQNETFMLLKGSSGFWVLKQTENNGVRGIEEIHGPVTFNYGNFIDAVCVNENVYVVFSNLIGKLNMSTCTVTTVKTGSFSKVIWLDSTEQYMVLQNSGNSYFLDSRGLTSTTITGSGVAEISVDFIVSNKVQSGVSFTSITVYDRDGKVLFSKSVSGKKMYYTNVNTGTSSMFVGLTGTEGVLIASDSSARIFKSFDFGETWNQIQGPYGLNITSYTRKGFVVLQTEFGTWFSNDNFNTVQTLFSGDLGDAQLTTPIEFHRNGKIAGIKMITIAGNSVDICEVPKMSLTEQKQIIEDYYLSDADTGDYGRRYYLRLGQNFCIQYGSFPLYDIKNGSTTTVEMPFKLPFKDDSSYVLTANCINAINTSGFSCEITQTKLSSTSVTLKVAVSSSSNIPVISIGWMAVGAPK